MTEDRDLETDTESGSTAPNAEQTIETPNRQPERRGPPPNPLYHPLFLPVLLIAFALWFGYDGFLTSDPDMLKHQTFNRVMFAIMLPLCIWMVPSGIREFRETQARAKSEAQEQADQAHSDSKSS